MSDAPLWIDERDIATLLTLVESIDVLADAYRLVSVDAAYAMRSAHLRVGD